MSRRARRTFCGSDFSIRGISPGIRATRFTGSLCSEVTPAALFSRWLLIFFCVLATLTWAFNLYALYLLNTAPAWLCRFHWLIQPHPVHEPLALHYARAVLLTVSATAVLVLFFSNRIHGTRDVEGKSESGPTGCWNLWKEINEINKEWIEEAVFSRAPTYADAVLLLQNPAWRAAHGYLPSRHSTVPGTANI